MRFDPKQSRRHLKGFSIEFYSTVNFGEAKDLNCLTSYGDGMLRCAIECNLVGCFDHARELAQRASIFFHAASELKEVNPTFGELHAVMRESGYAFARWLLYGSIHSKNLIAAARARDAWFEADPALGKREIQWALTDYLEAEEYESVIARFDWAGVKKPKNLLRIQGEGAMCYAIAQQRLEIAHSTEEIETAIGTFLKRHMAGWLGSGQRDTAARWLKIAFWKKKDDPVATLLRAYDYLPDLKPPKYPPRKTATAK
jgi:hypothetical protein